MSKGGQPQNEATLLLRDKAADLLFLRIHHDIIIVLRQNSVKQAFKTNFKKMMSFENVRVGVDVEVLLQGYLVSGKVRWKGSIPERNGYWVGLELDERAGNHSGLYKGIQYFQCTDGYGTFVRASQLRFPPTKGRSKSCYNTLSKISFVDESLFKRKADKAPENSPFKPAYIPQTYASNVKSLFQDRSFSLDDRKYFPLRHPIGGARKHANTTNADCNHTRKSLFSFDRMEGRRSVCDLKTSASRRGVSNQFFSSPSIPLIHDPKRKLKICW